MVDAVSSCSPCLAQLLLRLLLSSLLLVSPLSRAEDARNSSSGSLNSNSTATLESNSTKAKTPYPAVSLSLSLGISQELNPNPFVHPNPILSLSLSLSVSEELKGNPFDFVSLPPQPADQNMRLSQLPQQHQQHQHQHQQQRQRAEQQQSQVETSTAVGRGKCAYTVSIKTSCSSPRVTRDAISLAFGDAYRNEVYAARLDDPASGTFDRCSMDTFRVVGPCGSRTCYLYLRRSGRDGWTPEYAKIFYNLKGDSRAAVTFPYNAPLPDGVWYGFNLCHDAGAAARPEATAVQRTKADGKKVDDDDDRGDPTIKVKTKVGGSVRTVIFKI